MQPSMNKSEGKSQAGSDYQELQGQLRDKKVGPFEPGDFAKDSIKQNSDAGHSKISKPNFGEAQLAQTDGHGEKVSDAGSL